MEQPNADGSPLPENASGDSPEPDYYTVSLTVNVTASSFQEAAWKFVETFRQTWQRTVLVEHGLTLEQRYVEV